MGAAVGTDVGELGEVGVLEWDEGMDVGGRDGVTVVGRLALGKHCE